MSPSRPWKRSTNATKVSSWKNFSFWAGSPLALAAASARSTSPPAATSAAMTLICPAVATDSAGAGARESTTGIDASTVAVAFESLSHAAISARRSSLTT